MSLLITGSTGFVGSVLVPRLAARGQRIDLLVRPASRERARRLFGALPGVNFVVGDLCEPRVVEDVEIRARLIKNTESVLHMGAAYNIEGSHEEAYLSNVVGTQNLLSLAEKFTALKSFHYVSTLAVAGDFKGTFLESCFSEGQRFGNPYAATKYRAEGFLGGWRPELVRRVYRLGIVVGDSRTGAIPKIDGPYYFLRFLQRWRSLSEKSMAALLDPALLFGAHGAHLPVPFDPQTLLYLIPVDWAASLLDRALELGGTPTSKPHTYHFVGEPVPIAQFVRASLDAFGIKGKAWPVARRLVPRFAFRSLGMPESILDYMYSLTQFDVSNVQTDFGSSPFPAFDKYSETLFRFARENLGVESWREGGGLA